MNSLKGKVAMVTGAANKRSMGHAIVQRLARERANIVIVDKDSSPRSLFPGDENWGGMDEVVKEVRSSGSDALAVIADISKSSDVDTAVTGALNKFGRIDILVHCAAIRGPVGTVATDLAEEDWRRILDVNTTGSFLISRAVAKQMVAKREGGKIVLIASMAGTEGFAGSAAYCVSKWGVIGLVKTLALELAKHRINVNAINPGVIMTNLRDTTFTEISKAQGISWDDARKKDYEMVSTRIPLGRLGTTDEIADLAFFLSSDQSSYITGVAINISGGIG
jgi:NAD(P)-dependent dehydrogenase (short-subunit alcohol dehydrogenase family)